MSLMDVKILYEKKVFKNRGTRLHNKIIIIEN